MCTRPDSFVARAKIPSIILFNHAMLWTRIAPTDKIGALTVNCPMARLQKLGLLMLLSVKGFIDEL
jgi:hypothetical protein